MNRVRGAQRPKPYKPIVIIPLTESEYLDDLALIRFQGNYAKAAQYRGKTYGALVASTYTQRERGQNCLYYLNNLKEMRDKLPPKKRHILKPEIPIGYSKTLPRVGG